MSAKNALHFFCQRRATVGALWEHGLKNEENRQIDSWCDAKKNTPFTVCKKEPRDCVGFNFRFHSKDSKQKLRSAGLRNREPGKKSMCILGEENRSSSWRISVLATRSFVCPTRRFYVCEKINLRCLGRLYSFDGYTT